MDNAWSWIDHLHTFAWFDCVDSDSNPVDGINRKDFRGFDDWEYVSLPCGVLGDLRRAVCK